VRPLREALDERIARPRARLRRSHPVMLERDVRGFTFAR
jgi:hypothetical protein